MIMKPSIHFHYMYKQRFYFPHRNNLKNFILYLFNKEGFPVDTLNYIFCSDSFLLNINQKYLKHNTLTDIITFNLSDKNQPILSDIYISIERIIYNSGILNTSFKNELHRVVFHGSLHLCGYNDQNKNDKIVIRARENFYLEKYSRFT